MADLLTIDPGSLALFAVDVNRPVDSIHVSGRYQVNV